MLHVLLIAVAAILIVRDSMGWGSQEEAPAFWPALVAIVGSAVVIAVMTDAALRGTLVKLARTGSASWVAMNNVVPRRRNNSNKANTSRPVWASRLPVGSSHSTIAGSW